MKTKKQNKVEEVISKIGAFSKESYRQDKLREEYRKCQRQMWDIMYPEQQAKNDDYDMYQVKGYLKYLNQQEGFIASDELTEFSKSCDIFKKTLGKLESGAEGEEEHQGLFLANEPEFFSTIRPEAMTDGEVDLTDDLSSASAYFENSLFVGDSRMEYIQDAKLVQERIGTVLSRALFLTADTYSWKSLGDEFSGGALTFNLYGDYVTLQGALEKTGAKKLFIQIGREDLAGGDITSAIDNAQNALVKLKAACPQTEIIVLPLTPNTADSVEVPSNNTIEFYNEELYSLCLDRGIRYLDTTTAFPMDVLPAEYCADAGDTGSHLNVEGSLLWVNALLEKISEPQSTPTPAPVTENSEVQNESSGETSAPMNVAGREIVNQN